MSPTITEIISSLGKEDLIVGVTNFCNYPKSACSKTKIGSALTPDMEKILSLRPDIIFTPRMQNSKVESKGKKLGLKLINLGFDSFQDIKDSIALIGNKLQSKKLKEHSQYPSSSS